VLRDHAQQPKTTRSAGAGGSDPSLRTFFLGRYRVVDEIGVGGMASVHLARVDGLGGFQKWMAIKRIHSHLVEDESFVNMFFDEARVAARISHPNVATVFDLGKDEDSYWIAMEYLHGEPLREAMRRTEQPGQPMPPEIACRIIADAAEGLHAAHELLGPSGEKLNVVHRDVTPHNLFVTYAGVTKVVDFGIAKFSSRMANTSAGTLKGKVAYMSPEQIGGEPIDRRTDIFALGVVLWELTTGQRLFRMESDLDTMAKVKECSPPRPSTIVRAYPIDLEEIVMKALSKNRNERYRTARELSRALQSLLMRRGLFVGSDEVASYMQFLFADRIRKRDEHLRWAADVTNTDDVGNHDKSGPPAARWGELEPSELTGSERQATQNPTARAAPRPAAGAPAPLEGQTTTEEDIPTVAPRMMTRSELATLAAQGEAFDEAADTVVSDLPDMSEFLGLEATTDGAVAPEPYVPRLPTPTPVGTRVSGATVTAQAVKQGVPTWAVLLGAALLGVLAFVAVLFTLSRLSPPRPPQPAAIVGEHKP
jgi:serine/threonine-protein kinase